jgi:hypothetical protein
MMPLRATSLPKEPAASNGLKRILVWCIKGIVTVGLLAWLFLQNSLSFVLANLQAVSATTVLVAVSVLFLLSLCTAFRWRIVLRRFGATVAFPAVWAYTLVGTFFNQVLPTGVGGDAFRAWYARRANISTRRALATVVVDRMFALIAVVVIVIAGIPTLSAHDMSSPAVLATVAGALLLAAAAMGLLLLDKMSTALLSWLPRIRKQALQLSMERLADGVAIAASSTRALLGTWPDGALAMGISLANQVVIGIVVYLLMRDMGGTLALINVVLLFPCVLLISMLPISFGGWGVREGAMILIFSLAGVPSEVSLTSSILFGLCLVAASLPGAAVWLFLRQHSGNASPQ